MSEAFHRHRVAVMNGGLHGFRERKSMSHIPSAFGRVLYQVNQQISAPKLCMPCIL